MNLKTIAAGCVIASSLTVAGSANAAAIVSFENGSTQSGSLSYAGGNTNLVGNGIVFNTVSATGTPTNPGTFECVNCTMDFTTGALNSSSSASGVMSYTFGAGGSLTLTGQVPSAGINSTSTLASGSMSGPVNVSVVAGHVALDIGTGTDEKHPSLESFFGYVPAEVFWLFANTTIAAFNVTGGNTPGAAFSGQVTNVEFDNIPVPVPLAFWLLASSLAAMGMLAQPKG